MRILITGASSFTGAWFATDLAAHGHDVTATFSHAAGDYPDDLRRARAAWVSRTCRVVTGPRFGDEAFMALLASSQWDVLAHHGADVTNYRSPDFDVAGAVQNNTRNLNAVLRAFQAAGGSRVVLTGSVFEGGEGAGSDGLPDFSPYGLSKRLTSEVFRFQCAKAGVPLGKFVIPNPFGPHEEARYTAYLMKTWMKGEVAGCNTPRYVRDNIHVSLLSLAYAQFVAQRPEAGGFTRLNPCGYAESQGAFTLRLAEAMRSRLGKPCEVALKVQAAFDEPAIRINTDMPDTAALGWDEATAWNRYAEHYLSQRG